MKEKFFGYIPYDDEINEKLWKESIFVFDANIFLNLYRYSNETKNKVISCLERISDRVWIPYNTGKEFFNNRVTTILDQEEVYKNLEKNLNFDGMINFISGIRHTTLDSKKKTLIEIIKKCKEEINEIIQEDKNSYKNLIYDDPNLEKILKIFDGKVGQELSKDDFEKYKKIIDKRYEKQIPPGYKDCNKSDDTKNEKGNSDKKYGDAINWLEVIKFSKENKTDIIYVTDDKKEDWIEVKKGKKIGPRKELLNEFHKETNGRIIGIYNTENFLKYSNKYLGDKNSEEHMEINKAISEIEYIDNSIKSKNSISNKSFLTKLYEEIRDNNLYVNISDDFTCPECGRSTQNGDYIYDAGNGFCQDCSPEH